MRVPLELSGLQRTRPLGIQHLIAHATEVSPLYIVFRIVCPDQCNQSSWGIPFSTIIRTSISLIITLLFCQESLII